MTTTYDPLHPAYRDEADLRGELSRVFDVCNGCRACVDLCPTFPMLFDRIAHRTPPSGSDAMDAGSMTPADQDEVVETCYQCDRCAERCPYLPDRHELAIDVPRVMLRAKGIIHDGQHRSLRAATAAAVTARTERNGRVATTVPLVGRIAAARPGSVSRRVLTAVTGVSAERLLPPYAKQRFSTWFRRRSGRTIDEPQAVAMIHPTCLVEYHQPAIGRAAVGVLEHNDVATVLSAAGCCGAALLHAGDIDGYTAIARRTTDRLAAELGERGDDAALLVLQPTCRRVLVDHAPGHLGTPEAALVASRAADPAEFLLGLHHDPDRELDTDFGGDVPDAITYHLACHARTGDTPAAATLLGLTGAEVTVVARCSGSGDGWGLQASHDRLALSMAASLGAEVAAAERTPRTVIAGDCHVANTAITEQRGDGVANPLQVLARAYRLADDD